jgi:hypothetical protein
MKSLAAAEFWRNSLACQQKCSRMREKQIDFGFAIHITTPFASRRLVASGQFESHAVIALLDTSHWFWIGPHDKYERILMK